MPIPTFTGLPPDPTFEDMKDKLNTVVKELQNLLLNLDTLNVTRLNAEVIEANTITAEKMNVNELSAITANLGHITAGLIESIEIYGSLISTNRYGYPKAEISNTQNMFSVNADENSYLNIYASGQNSSPQFTLKGPNTNLTMLILGLTTYLSVTGGNLHFDGNNIELSPSLSGRIEVPYWNQVYSKGDGENLKTALNGKATSGVSTSLSGGHNHGIPAGTQFKAVDGTVYTWYPADNHSHAQN